MTNSEKYYRLSSSRKSIVDRSINSLLGLIEGISADGVVNASEARFLDLWMTEHRVVSSRHPYSELIPVVSAAVADGILSQEERDDIRWLCERLKSTQFADAITADLQRLHGLLGGVAADGLITSDELLGLEEWLTEHQHLSRCWPYDEVCSLITSVLGDGRIGDDEHKILLGFFSEFVEILDNRTLVSPQVEIGGHIVGLCAVCPDIALHGSSFCFTGASNRYSRSKFSEIIQSVGGSATDRVSHDLDYLVIGAEGNPCWAFSCYGRKVERAVELRKQGSRLLIIHENDLHDALADSNFRI